MPILLFLCLSVLTLFWNKSHSIPGVGCPSAAQVRLTAVAWRTVLLNGDVVISGASEIIWNKSIGED